MLEKIKKSSESTFTKFILALISASFVFFGFGKDFMGGDNTALTIADRNVSIQEFDEELKRQIAQMQSIVGNGTKLNYKQALQMGLVDQIIDNLSYRILLDKEAKERGIAVSDEKIYEIIKKTKEFQDDKGNFSPEKLAYILENNAISEEKFVSEIANGIAREILVNSVISSIDNKFISEIMYKQNHEKRIFDIVEIEVANENITKKPSDEELKDLYSVNLEKFSQPEYRKISYIVITPDMARKYRDIKKTDDDKTYKTMIEMGEDIIDEVNGGAKIADVIKSFGVERVVLPDLNVDGEKRDGTVFKDKVFTQKYRDIAFFALDEKGVSDVLDNGENIIVIMVDAVYPKQPKTFENVKSQLVKMWTDNKKVTQASTRLNGIVQRIEDGKSLNEAINGVENAKLSARVSSERFSNSYSSDLMTKLFNAELNKPVVSKDGKTYYVALVREVIIPEITEKDKEAFKKFEEQQKQNFANVVMDDYLNYLYKKYGVKKHAKVIDRLFH